MRLDFLYGCVHFACIRAFFLLYYGGDNMKKLMAFLGTKMIENSIGEQAKAQSLTGEEIRELRRRGAYDFDQLNYDVLEDRSDSEKALMWLEYVGIPDHNKLINEIGR